MPSNLTRSPWVRLTLGMVKAFMKTFLLTAVFLGPGVCAAQTDRTDQFIQKAVTPMGGLHRIHAIHSLVFRGFHYEGSYKQEIARNKTGDAVLIRMWPGERLVGCRPG